jgi:hypothetical protein
MLVGSSITCSSLLDCLFLRIKTAVLAGMLALGMALLDKDLKRLEYETFMLQ